MSDGVSAPERISSPGLIDRLRSGAPNVGLRWAFGGPPLIAGGVALVLAWSAMLPGVAYWDTAEFQTVAPVLGTAHPTGYPSYVILGWLANFVLAPLGEPAFRMNLFAGLSLAVAAGLAAVLVQRLTGRASAGIAAGIGFAATPLAWRIGTHADPHALHVALVGLLLVLLVGWEDARRHGSPTAGRWLIGAAAAFGLAAANHSLTLLLAPAIGLYVLAVQPSLVGRPRLVAACAAAVLGTMALLYLELPIRAGILRAPLVYAHPETWDGFWYIALGQQFQGSVSSPLDDLSGKLGDLVALASRELGVLTLFVPAAFIVTVGRFPRYALLTGVAALVTAVFAGSYVNADIERYYLGPLLMAWTWLGILAATAADALATAAGFRVSPSPVERGLPPVIRSNPPVESAVAPVERPRPPLFPVALGLAMAALLVVPAALALPARHRLVDETSNRDAASWLDAALDRIPQNAVLVSWWSYSTPLWYAQLVEGRRTDIFVVDDRTMLDLGMGGATDVIARYLGQRPVYVIRANQHDLDLVRARFAIQPGSGAAANVYEVLGPAGSAAR